MTEIPGPVDAIFSAADEIQRLRSQLEAVTAERDKLAFDLQLRRPTDADVAQTHAARKEYRAKLKELYGNADALPMKVARLTDLLTRAGEVLNIAGSSFYDDNGDVTINEIGLHIRRQSASLHSEIKATLEGK